MISSDFSWKTRKQFSFFPSLVSNNQSLPRYSLCGGTGCAVFLALCYELSDRNITIRSMKTGELGDSYSDFQAHFIDNYMRGTISSKNIWQLGESVPYQESARLRWHKWDWDETIIWVRWHQEFQGFENLQRRAMHHPILQHYKTKWPLLTFEHTWPWSLMRSLMTSFAMIRFRDIQKFAQTLTN